MKIPRLKKGYEHFEAAPVVLLALLKRFCNLNMIDITNEKLIGLLNEYKTSPIRKPT
jgi:hypothetical protein